MNTTNRLSGILLGALVATSVGAAEVVAVTVERFDALAVHPERNAPATVVSLNESRIGAEIAARILEVPVRVGDPVREGDVLARLDCADHELAVRRERAALKAIEARAGFARSQLERTEALVRQRSVSEDLLEQRRSELAVLVAEHEAAEVALASAQRNVARCVVAAPYDGVLLERLAQVGELANPGTPLVRLLDRVRLEVSAQVQAHDVPTLSAGTSPLFIDRTGRYPVRVRAVTQALDPRARHQEVRLEFADQPALPGSAGRLVWREEDPHVPADLVVRRGGELGVFLATQGVARFHGLNGALEGQPARAVLPPDAALIVAGRNRLQDGDPVSVQP
jgi:membrane fusion protein, multidrug efflux system